MTDRLREAAQAALEALELIRDADTSGATPKQVVAARKTYEPTIEQLRAAMAEPESSVCFKCQGKGSIYLGCDSWVHCETCNATGRIYPMPPRREWRGLTAEETRCLGDKLFGFYPGPDGPIVQLVRAVEAALKEKNHD